MDARLLLASLTRNHLWDVIVSRIDHPYLVDRLEVLQALFVPLEAEVVHEHAPRDRHTNAENRT